LLSFGTESFVFHFATQNFKDYHILNYDSAFVLYGCKTWSVILREEHRLRVFENRVLRRILGPRSDEVTRGTEKTT
jgi:hypothetical protein